MALLFALVGGFAIALTIQLLFANLGLALGLSFLNLAPAKRDSAQVLGDGLEDGSEGGSDESEGDSADQSTEKGPDERYVRGSARETSGNLPVTNLLGVGVLLSATSTTFVAALVSTEFGNFVELRRGVIFGLIVWAIYWLLFVWLSTTTVTSVVESLWGTAIAGGKELLSLTQQLRHSAQSDARDEDWDENRLKAMSDELLGELSQISEAQKALPKLLAEQREQLVAEVCDRTQLSRIQAEAILNHVQPSAADHTETEATETDSTQTEAAATTIAADTSSRSMGLLANLGATAKSTVRSAVASQVDIPSWQQVSQKIIDNVDISDLESLWQQTSHFLDEAASDDSASDDAEKSATSAKARLSHPTEKLPERTDQIQQTSTASLKEQTVRQASAATKAIQKKLIAYLRYTNPEVLTPDSLVEKIAAQQDEKKIQDLGQTEINVDAIADVIRNRKTLSEVQKRALVTTLKTSISPSSNQSLNPSHHTSPDYTEPSAFNTDHADFGSPQRSSLPQLPDALAQAKGQIAQYLHTQDKTTLQPQQIAQDLTRIVGSTLQSIPHPSQLPARSQLANLWDKSFWQKALAQRKDLTVEEMQQVLGWVESGWEPMTHQANSWIQALQTEASQLLEVPEEMVEEARQQIVEQMGAVKEKVDAQVIALKLELQAQADIARKQAVIAAWWLFCSMLLSSLAAGGASWLAIRY